MWETVLIASVAPNPPKQLQDLLAQRASELETRHETLPTDWTAVGLAAMRKQDWQAAIASLQNVVAGATAQDIDLYACAQYGLAICYGRLDQMSFASACYSNAESSLSAHAAGSIVRKRFSGLIQNPLRQEALASISGTARPKP